MKAMKGMNVNRMLGSLKRKPNAEDFSSDSGLDTPEANTVRNVKLFCESGGPNGSGEEVLYLPTIVEACESSPSAAKEAAASIRKFLSKDNFSKPYVQYNAIMLIRILADNPGRTFTRNLDKKFVEVIKELLRYGRDPSVKQLLMETMDTLQREKADDEGLALLLDMWKKEHEKMLKLNGPPQPRAMNAPPFDPQAQQNYFARNHKSRQLPPPAELSTRIEEARTSASLLSQVVQSTPPSELLYNELVREFADRCQSASRSVQAYMVAENPSPDNATMETLIETNELLGKAMSQHQRAVLNARRILGLGNGEPSNTPPEMTPPARTPSGFAAPPPARTDSGFAPPPGPPPSASKTATRKPVPIPPPGDYAPTGSDDEGDPFSDPKDSTTKNPPLPKDQPPTTTGQFSDRLGIEPYHPGFKESQSYVGRQNSSIGNTTMHAAVPETTAEEDDAGYGTAAGTKAPVYRY